MANGNGGYTKEAGQYESITGGREQDLRTPIWQTIALCVTGAWTLFWFFAWALACGPGLFYFLAAATYAVHLWWTLVHRHRQPWNGRIALWCIAQAVVHSTPAVILALLWTDYRLNWPPSLLAFWSLLCAFFDLAGGLLGYVLAVRLIDPNWPPPKKAVERYSPQAPWQPEPVQQPEAQAFEQDTRPIALPTVEKRGHSVRYRLPQIPTPRAGREWLARWFWRILRDDGVGFSINMGQNYHIQRDEVDAIQKVFKTEEWAVDRGGTQGYEPTDEGMDKMWLVVSEFYPTASLPREAA